MQIQNISGVNLYIGKRITLEEFVASREELNSTDGLTRIFSEAEMTVFKNEKIEEFYVDNFLIIDDYIYSSKRIDVLKYKEATDINEGRGDTTVKLNTGNGPVTLDIAVARDIIKQLSEKASDDYWAKQDFISLVNSKTTVAEVEAVVQ